MKRIVKIAVIGAVLAALLPAGAAFAGHPDGRSFGARDYGHIPQGHQKHEYRYRHSDQRLIPGYRPDRGQGGYRYNHSYPLRYIPSGPVYRWPNNDGGSSLATGYPGR
jgi:hypothetical protein